MLGTHIDFSFTFQRNHCLTIKYTNKERIFEQSSSDKGEIFRAQMAKSEIESGLYKWANSVLMIGFCNTKK